MNAEQEEKRAWLNRAFYAERNAQAWLAKLEQDRSLAERISRNHLTTGGTCSSNSTEDALVRLADTERQTQEKLKELSNIRDEITEAILHIDNHDLQAVLMWHYLNYLTFEQTAEKMHYSLITIRRKHKQALDEIELE